MIGYYLSKILKIKVVCSENDYSSCILHSSDGKQKSGSSNMTFNQTLQVQRNQTSQVCRNPEQNIHKFLFRVRKKE